MAAGSGSGGNSGGGVGGGRGGGTGGSDGKSGSGRSSFVLVPVAWFLLSAPWQAMMMWDSTIAVLKSVAANTNELLLLFQCGHIQRCRLSEDVTGKNAQVKYFPYTFRVPRFSETTNYLHPAAQRRRARQCCNRAVLRENAQRRR